MKAWLVLAVGALALGPAVAGAQPRATPPRGGQTPARGATPGKPVTVDADKMERFGKEGLVVFTGNVVARQDNSVQHADRMEVYLDEKGNRIVRTVSVGNVRIVTRDCRTGTARRAEYLDLEQRVVLSGDARVWQGDNIVTGETITIYLSQDRSVVQAGQNERVKAVFYPRDEAQGEGAAKPRAAAASTDGCGDCRRMDGLVAQGLQKGFRQRTVVDNVSLDIQRGEVVGLLGPNGAGKTTSFYMIVGLLATEGGRIFLEGQEITTLPMYQRCRLGIGYLPQESSVFRKLTVEENLLAILETQDLGGDERRERANELLAELDLTSLAPYPAYTLSGGERRRLEITRALVTSPQYLLLDEPFTGIDPIAIADIQEIVARLRERGIGILITDHNVRETLAITDRAYILYDGKILVSGTASEIANNPIAREIYLGEKFAL